MAPLQGALELSALQGSLEVGDAQGTRMGDQECGEEMEGFGGQ